MASLLHNMKTNLKKLRKARGWSQERLASKAGISVSYVSMLEQGKRSPPLETLEVLGKALSVPPEDLVRRPRASAAELDADLAAAS